MTEAVVEKQKIEPKKSVKGLDSCFQRAREYMDKNEGRLRFDYGLDMWLRSKEMDREVLAGNFEVVNNLVSLLEKSEINTNERDLFSKLASREIEVAANRLQSWDLDTVKKMIAVEELAMPKDRERLEGVFEKNREIIGGIILENTVQLSSIEDLVFSCFKENSWEEEGTMKHRLEELVCVLGLEKKITNDFIGSWASFDPEAVRIYEKVEDSVIQKRFRLIMIKNLETLRVLKGEIGEEGIKKLYSEYGITNFGRYPVDLLIRQIRGEKEQKAYGVWLGAYSDWNGAFMNKVSGNELKTIWNEAKKSGLEMKVIEARDKQSVVRRVVTLDRKFGGRNKISFVVINGHGTRDSVWLGSEKKDGLESEDLSKISAMEMRKYYADEAPFLFNSCSTGLEIAKEYSKFAGGYSLGPSAPTSELNIHLERDMSGRLFFDGNFSSRSDEEKPEAKIYMKGADYREEINKERQKLGEGAYQKMLKDKKSMKSVWSGEHGGFSLHLMVVEREGLEKLRGKLKEDFGEETKVLLETGFGGEGDDSNEHCPNLILDLGKEAESRDWGTGFIESVGTGCRYIWRQKMEVRDNSWPEVRVIEKGEDGKKKILARYKIDMSQYWPENIPLKESE